MDVFIHCVTKQAEHKLRLIPVAQFQYFHDVREVNLLATTARENCVHKLRGEFVKIGRNGTGLCRGENSDIARREAIRVPLRRAHDKDVIRENRGQGVAEATMLHLACRNEGNHSHLGTARRSFR